MREVAATTLVGAACSANATMPDGRRIDLGGQTANQVGDVHWIYPPKSVIALGQGMHAVSCRLGAQSATSSVPFDVGS
ncbi:MAG TPA: hypothetical protein VGS16_06215 [Candidatus Dormibacteraeota bacterium]|nr:hypothetical protein [Candidatus Dormibacteraeota bacterium]